MECTEDLANSGSLNDAVEYRTGLCFTKKLSCYTGLAGPSSIITYFFGAESLLAETLDRATLLDLRGCLFFDRLLLIPLV